MNPGQEFPTNFVTDSVPGTFGFDGSTITVSNLGPISFNSHEDAGSFNLKQENTFSDYLQQAGQMGPESSLSSYDLSPKKGSLGSPQQKGEKPYVCQVCGQSFTQVSNLKRHERLHTGEKPYSCNQCGKAFSTISNLKQHQQIHENVDERTKFQCQKCMKTYFYQSSLNKHMKTHLKKEMKAEIEKSSKSMSPRKGRPVISTIHHDKSDGSLPSDESMSESSPSPTIKKVKKEKIAPLQLTATSRANADSSKQTLDLALGSNNNPSVSGMSLEEEFHLDYQRNLVKVLNQFPTNLSLMGLQYLSISGAAPSLSQGYNMLTGTQNQPLSFMNPAPDMRFPTGTTSIGSELIPNHLKMEESHDSLMVERQQPESYLPPYQNVGLDFNDGSRPNIFNFLEHDLFGQKQRMIQESLLPNGFSDNYWAGQNDPLFNQTNINELGGFTGYFNNEMADEFVAPITQKNEGEADMIDYEMEKRHDDTTKQVSLGNDFNGMRFF